VGPAVREEIKILPQQAVELECRDAEDTMPRLRLQPGERTAADWNACNWPFDRKGIRFVILTYAHIDHCILISMLYRRGSRGFVYCSKGTAEIAKVLLLDASKLSDIGFTSGDVDVIRWHEPLKGPLLGRFYPVD
jgi:metallo-beta-lactamase family protein